MEITTLINDFYDFIVYGISEYLFVFNLHYILAYITILVGIKYTNNFKWYEKLLNKVKLSAAPFTGFLLILEYTFIGTGGISVETVVSLLQSFIITLSLQDVFIVLFGVLLNKLTFGMIKLDHNKRSINYVKTNKNNDDVELDKKQED